MGYPTLKIAVYADGANKDDMIKRYQEGFIKGFTTNPTLMAKAGLHDYEAFGKSVLSVIKTLPISFEVFSDDFSEMERQAIKIGSWAQNVNIKIPITNTKGESSAPLIEKLFGKGLKINVTAIFTMEQLQAIKKILTPKNDVILSIFAGRIADTGKDPMPLMKATVQEFKKFPLAKILWASPREVLNIYQAQDCGCQIITATNDLIDKLHLYNKSHDEYSLDTVKMFFNDAKKAGFSI